MTRHLLLLASLLALAPSATWARGPSTAAERRRAVEATHRLEQKPLEPSADERRAWLMKWIEDVPDITVRGCSGPLDALAEDEGGERYGRQLMAQSVFGMATWLVEHPRRKDDWVAVQTAGIESVLRAYRAILAAEPEARWPVLDQLLAARRQGGLARVVAETMKACGEAAEEEAGTYI